MPTEVRSVVFAIKFFQKCFFCLADHKNNSFPCYFQHLNIFGHSLIFGPENHSEVRSESAVPVRSAAVPINWV